MTRFDRRLAIAAANGINLSLAAAFLLGRVDWADKGISWWSTTIQLIGTLTTGLGLFIAWARATQFWATAYGLAEEFLTWLLRRPKNRVIDASSALAIVSTMTAAGWVGLGSGAYQPIDERIRRIEDYLNTSLRNELNGLSQDAIALGQSLKDATAHQEEAVRAAREHTTATVKRFRAQLDTVQARDLLLAIFGLLVTAVGIFLSYWVPGIADLSPGNRPAGLIP